MKILFVTTISTTVNTFLIPHIKLLVKQGHQVDVAFNIVGELNPELDKMGCKIHNIGFQRSPLKKENLNAYRKVKRLVLEESYDLVHTHTPVASLLTRLACRKVSNLKILYTAHGFHFFKGAPFKNWILYYTMERITAKWTDGIITLNKEDYLSAKKFKLRQPNSVFNVPGVGIDLNKFTPQSYERKKSLRDEYNYNSDDFILIFVGELSYTKHQDLLIDALNIVKSKISNIKLLLVGSGPLSQQYKEQVKKFGLEENIDFLGYRKDVNNLMMLSDIAVSSSRREGLPVNIMEAMATGLPIIVTNSRGNRDLIIHNVNGLIVGINSKNEFANAIIELCNSKQLRNEYGQNNIKYINKYSTSQITQEMTGIYNNYSK